MFGYHRLCLVCKEDIFYPREGYIIFSSGIQGTYLVSKEYIFGILGAMYSEWMTFSFVKGVDNILIMQKATKEHFNAVNFSNVVPLFPPLYWGSFSPLDLNLCPVRIWTLMEVEIIVDLSAMLYEKEAWLALIH